MYKIDVTCIDGEKISGFIADRILDDKQDIVFDHAEGGIATIPQIDVKTKRIGTKKVKPKFELHPIQKVIFRKAAPTKEKKEKKKPTVTKGPSPKLQQVVELRKANPTLNRKQSIELIVKELGMTAGGASTYYSNANKLIVDAV